MIDLAGNSIHEGDLELTEKGREIVTDLFLLMNICANQGKQVEYSFRAADNSGTFKVNMEFKRNDGREKSRGDKRN